MKWKEIEFEKLRVGDIFKSAGSPGRVYQVDEISVGNNFIDPSVMDLSATSFGKEASGLHFVGIGSPFFRLEMPGMEALDALATRNVELRKRFEQHDAQYNELLAKWKAKREAEQKIKQKFEETCLIR